MIFNLHGCDAQEKIRKFKNHESYDTFVTDAVHIHNSNLAPIRSFTNVWLIWKPGDPVEPSYSYQSSTDPPHDIPLVRATSTLLIDPYALVSSQNIYIPYATTIETFNHLWKTTSDHSGDNLIYTQECFSQSATIHVNSTLRAYMVQKSEVWGDIINNVVADL